MSGSHAAQLTAEVCGGSFMPQLQPDTAAGESLNSASWSSQLLRSGIGASAYPSVDGTADVLERGAQHAAWRSLNITCIATFGALLHGFAGAGMQYPCHMSGGTVIMQCWVPTSVLVQWVVPHCGACGLLNHCA